MEEQAERVGPVALAEEAMAERRHPQQAGLW